ncbi:AN1-type zinc finger protein 4-like isoform X2 [Penaeus japonicus]|uniref:AN1-type zinc finger protein 4-like isoform X2 n=1 Tax=Penaeus japonicus TaxID=27405 RepID=UPI001C70FCE0|nr:AN1-type zinc finger protein 4-like isoform X2 [Penaeus japonicus]
MRGGYGGQGGRRTPANDQGKARRASNADDNANADDGDERPSSSSSPRETIVLESSYPPQGDFPEDDEEEEEEEEDDDALEVVVETLLGYTYRVRVSQWDTVAGLKALLYRTQGIPASHQHLLLGQTELLDDVCLMEQGVVDGSTLRLVLAMRGGPINARRLPTTHDDMLWREVTGFVDENKEDLWDGVGGRTVTLLVLRDGENVNLYRVIENEDGSFSPLNESWGSMGSDLAEEEALHRAQAADEEAMTRARMAELRARMDALKLKNRAKKEKNTIGVTSEGKERLEKKAVSVPSEAAAKNRLNLGDSQEHRAGGSRPNTRQRSGSGGKRLKTVNRWGGRGSRPTTQERNAELRRNSISRTSTRLKEIPTAHPPIPVDWTGRKPLDDIRPGDRKRLPAVNEERGKGSGQKPLVTSQTVGAQPQKSAYASYRKSLVRHGLVTNSGKEIAQNDKDSREAWPRREGPVPLYMPPQTAQKGNRHEADPLYRSHNQDLLRTTQRTPNIRPKTSPEVLERRPASMGGESTVSDRIQIRAPDDRLREIVSILNTSRANSRHSNHSMVTPPGTANNASLSSSMTASNGLSNINKNKSVSVSLASLRNNTPPSPGNGALVASGTREQRDILRGIMNSKGLGSRRTTPDEGRRRLGSGRHQSSPTHLPPVTPQKRKARRKPRCDQCSRRLRIGTTFECRCNRVFCSQHRHAEEHACTFDYRAEGRRLLEMANPVIAPHRLPKI